MTDIEINKALALAIGWKDHQIDTDRSEIFLCTSVATLYSFSSFQRFSHKDPAVIWSIAEKYNCFPERRSEMIPTWLAWVEGRGLPTEADTAAKAVALAVIGVNK